MLSIERGENGQKPPKWDAVKRALRSPHGIVNFRTKPEDNRKATRRIKNIGEGAFAIGLAMAPFGVVEPLAVALVAGGLSATIVGASSTAELNQAYQTPEIGRVRSRVLDNEASAIEAAQQFIKAHQAAMDPNDVAPHMSKELSGLLGEHEGFPGINKLRFASHLSRGSQDYEIAITQIFRNDQLEAVTAGSIQPYQAEAVHAACARKEDHSIYVRKIMGITIFPDGTATVKESGGLSLWSPKRDHSIGTIDLSRNQGDAIKFLYDLEVDELDKYTRLVLDIATRAQSVPATIV